MPTAPAQVLSVTDLTHRIKDLLEDKFPSVWVEGEVSNLRSPSSGHVYFTLKDANAQLPVVLFRGVAAKVGFKLKDGLQVIASGDISVYEKSGQYQLVARRLLPKGLGALQLAFEELKQRLAKEGLFDPARKKPIPALPQHIGLITSPTGAAIRDFLNIIGRRFPNVHIVIHPVRVQGDGAAQEIAAANQYEAVICDRSVLDNYAYLVQRTGRKPQYDELVKSWVGTYTGLFKVPVLQPPTFDGTRAVSPTFQQEIDGQIDRLIEAFDVPVYRLDRTNRPGWVEEVLEHSKLPLEVPQIDLFASGA